MFGISWGGFSALQAAMRRPPALKAIIPACFSHDRYHVDVHWWGGTRLIGESVYWPVEMVGENALPPDPERFGPGWREEWLRRLDATPQWPFSSLRHQRRDDHWRHGSAIEDWGSIEAAVLALGGLSDSYRDSVLALLAGVGAPARGILGPWGHAWPHDGAPGPTIDGVGLMTRWWDRWLKGIDNGVDREPMLAAYLAEPMPALEYPERVPGRWWFADVWPPVGESVPWRLGADEALEAPTSGTSTSQAAASTPGADGGRSITWAGPPWVGVTAPFWAGSGPPEGLPVDQRPDEAARCAGPPRRSARISCCSGGRWRSCG